mgnify:FL=1
MTDRVIKLDNLGPLDSCKNNSEYQKLLCGFLKSESSSITYNNIAEVKRKLSCNEVETLKGLKSALEYIRDLGSELSGKFSALSVVFAMLSYITIDGKSVVITIVSIIAAIGILISFIQQYSYSSVIVQAKIILSVIDEAIDEKATPHRKYRHCKGR